MHPQHILSKSSRKETIMKVVAYQVSVLVGVDLERNLHLMCALCNNWILDYTDYTSTHACTHERTNARTHARTHALTHITQSMTTLLSCATVHARVCANTHA